MNATLKSPNKPQMSDHLQQASKSLAAFLESAEDRIFVLKGPYGAGKSFFLRWFLGTKIGQESATKLKFLSYVSVFGVNDLKELQNVMVGSLTLKSLAGNAKFNAANLNTALGFLQKAASHFMGGLNLDLSAGSAIWAIAKHQGLLLVIDDVDRKGSQLPLESIIGFANSLAEHTEGQTKVIFVLNEEQFSDYDSSMWSKLREKFIDNEFRFHPSAKELAGLFVDNTSVRELIGSIHERLKKPNIRSMRKVQSMAHRLADYLADQHVPLDPSEVAHAIRCAALYLHGGVPIGGDDFFRIYSKNFYIRDSDPPTEQEKALYALMQLIEFGPDSNMDSMFIAFFRDGTIDPDMLATFVKDRIDEQTREKFQKDEKDLWDCVNANFKQDGREFITLAREYLRNYRHIVGHQNLDFIIKNLEALGEDATDEWTLWLRSRVPNLDSDAIERLRPAVPEHLHPMLDAQKENVATIDPTSVFRDLHDHDRFGTPKTIAELAKWTEEDFLKWFSESDDPRLFDQLRTYLRFSYEPGDLLNIKNVLASALRKQAESSPFDARRVGAIFGNLIYPS